MGCEDRQSGCHSKCKKYGEWNERRLQEKNKFRKEAIKNKRYEEYVITTIEGFKKGKWGKR